MSHYDRHGSSSSESSRRCSSHNRRIRPSRSDATEAFVDRGRENCSSFRPAPDRPTVLTVPGKFGNLDQTLSAIGGNPQGYVLKLKKGCHLIGNDHQVDASFVRIEGDPAAFKGVGYIHGLGQWQLGPNWVQSYDASVGGLGPWTVEVVNKCQLTVRGTNGCDPDFSGVCPGDTLVLFRTNDNEEKEFTEHTLKCGDKQSVFIDQSTPLPNDFCHCDVRMGDGFYVRPTTTIMTKCPQQLHVTGHLDYSGIHFKVAARFNTGSLRETVNIEHSANSGDIELFGTYAIYKPNVHIGKVYVASGNGGKAMYQSHMGEQSTVEHSSTFGSAWRFGIFSGNFCGHRLKNAGRIDASYTDYHLNAEANRAEAMSTIDFRGSRYLACASGVITNVSGTSSSQPIFDDDPDQHRSEFNSCALASNLDFNSHGVVDDAIYTNNQIDLLLDGVPKPIISTDHTSGDYGQRFSTFIYTNIITG